MPRETGAFRMNKYLTKLAEKGFTISPERKREAFQMATLASATYGGGVLGMHLARKYPKVSPKKLGLITGAVGIGLDYGAVRVNNLADKLLFGQHK